MPRDAQPSPAGNRLFLNALVVSVAVHLCLLLLLSQPGQQRILAKTAPQVITVALVAPLTGEPSPPLLPKTASRPEQSRANPAAEPAAVPDSKPMVRPDREPARKPAVKPIAKPAAKPTVRAVAAPAPPPPGASFTERPRAAPIQETSAVAVRATSPDKAGDSESIAAPGNTAMASPAQPSSPRDSESESSSQAALQAYQSMLREKIERHKSYPLMARKGRQQGTATVFFELDRDGSLLSCEIDQSSGFRLLDRAALKAIRTAAPFPPLPPPLHLTDNRFALPVKFLLE